MRCRVGVRVLAAASLIAAQSAAARAPVDRCGPDAVRVGPACVDRYENSVWSVPSTNGALLAKVRSGRATLADLTGGGAMQVGAVTPETCLSVDYGAGFPPTGNWTAPLYAVSVAGVLPSTCLTWFQAEQACRLSGKRLLTNEEWQAAAAGTPDPNDADDGVTTCATNGEFAALAGSRSACVSAWGAHDMIGNVWEYVADWTDVAQACTNLPEEYGGDITCMGANVAEQPTPAAGAALRRVKKPNVVAKDIFPIPPSVPGVMIRGGNFAAGARNGVFALFAGGPPFNASRSTGFRCAR